MGIFCNVNQNKLNLIVEKIPSCQFSYQPILLEAAKSIFQSNETTLKAVACAQFLIQWQNNLDEQITDSNPRIFFDENAFDRFTQSQRALNKLKRKFSRLVIHDMPLDQRESLLRETADKLKVQLPDVSVLEHLFYFQGDDRICLEMLGLYANHRLKLPHRPPGQLVTLYGDANYRPDARVVMAVASTVEHFPFASNTWGFPGQESWPSTAFTKQKGRALVSRRAEFLKKCPPVVESKTPWAKVVPPSELLDQRGPSELRLERFARPYQRWGNGERFDDFARDQSDLAR